MKMMTDEQSEILRKLTILANNDTLLIDRALRECQKWKKIEPSLIGRLLGRKTRWMRSADLKDVIEFIKENRPPYWIPSNIP